MGSFSRFWIQPVFLLLVAWSGLLSGLEGRAWSAPRQGSWVTLAEDGRLLYQLDELGNRILDYSGCGYLGGKEGIPQVPTRVVVKPGDGDDRARIQAAIDQVSSMSPDANGYRGAVLLTAGEYQVSASLNLTTSGVVLRGVGESETDGTRLLFTDTSGSVSNQTALIQIGGTGSTSGSGYTRTIVSPYVPAGSRSFDVDNVSTFAVGDAVMVYRPSTSAWITMLGMDQLEAGTQWQPGDRDLNFQRTIVRIEGNRVFLDAPIPTAIDAAYGGGTIKKYTFAGRIEKCGVENLRGLSVYAGPTDESHGWICVKIGVAQNCWVRRVTARYFAGNAVAMVKGAKWISVLNCTSLDPVSVITGERRYAFFMDDAEFCLVRDCSTANDRHQFVTGSNTSGPNAFVNGTSTNAWSDAGPHHRWSSGILWDRIVVSDNELNLRNRGNLGSGHGWSGANSVAWNCQATALDVENPPTARNWLIGSVGTLTATNPYAVPPNPNFGTYDSNGASVFPLSLWGNQRQDQLARSQVQVREYTVGDFDLFTPSGATGDTVTVDSTWLTSVSNAAVAAGALVGNLDDTRTNRWVPWTHAFSLDAGDAIVSASLSFSVRSTGSGWTNDVLRIETTGSSVLLSSLGAVSLSTSNSTVLRYDLAPRLSDLADGKLNLAVSQDVAVDWSVLELRVAPASSGSTQTVTLIAEADSYIQGGANATNNFGSNTSLLVKEAASADVKRKALLRWNLTAVTNRIVEAKVRLNTASSSTNLIENCVGLASNNWTESTLNWNNQPASQAPFYSWFATNSSPTVEFNVTREVQEAMAVDGLLTLQISSARDVGGSGTAGYTSREGNSSLRPQLILTTVASTNAGPSASTVGNQTTRSGMALDPVVFGVGDGEIPPTLLTVTASSGNSNVISEAGLVLGGSGAIRTLQILPTATAGESVVTVKVSDGALTNTQSFTLKVLSAQQGWWMDNFGVADPGTGVTALTADPDGDGMSNFLEYALAGNPWAGDGVGKLPVATLESGGIRFLYSAPVAGLNYRVQSNTNLGDTNGWTNSSAVVTTNTDGTMNIVEPVGSAARRFYRLNIVSP
jgi:hypothetical protein